MESRVSNRQDLIPHPPSAAQLAKLHLEVVVRYAKGPSGTILRQSVTPGLAAGPGLKIRLVVAR